MKRRHRIAAVLCALGIIGYFFFSRGPLRIQLLTVPTQLFFLVSISWIAWATNLSLRVRLASLFCFIVLTTVVTTYLDSLVIRALTPLHYLYFAASFLGFSLEALLFLGFTWLIDRIIDLGKDWLYARQRSQTR